VAHDDEKSVWKKEISFKRKPRGEEPAAGDGEGSVWKKEISLGRKRKEEAPAPAEPAAAEPEPLPELDIDLALPAAVELPAPLDAAALPDLPPPAPVEHDWLTQPLEQISEPPPLEEPSVPEPPAPLHAVPALEPDPVPPEPAVPAPPPAAEVAAEAPVPAELAPPPPGYDDLFDLGLDALVLDEPAVSEPAPAPAPDPAPVAVPVPEPEPAAASVPFYKRELSFGRTRPKAPKEPKAAKAPKEPKPAKAPKPAKESKPRRELPKLSLPSLQLPTRGGGGAKSLVGLKIGSSQLAAARVQNGDTPELVQAVRDPLEAGIVVGGELRDPEALAVALKDFFSRHKLPRRGVRLGIANNRIGVRTFDVVGIEDPKQLDNAIKFRAQEVLPIPIEEAVLDYQVLGGSTNDEGQPVRRVLLVVAYRDLVDRYVLACRKAGIQVVGIDLEAFALLRALAEPRPEAALGVAGSEHGALVAVSVGHERSTFAVSDGRVCEFTRVLEWGGWAINVAIARALDKAPSEAEPIKRALSFAGSGALPDGITQAQLDTARDAAAKQLQTFARELVSSLQFYQGQPGSLGIAEIVVTGGTTHLPGFGAELERLLGVPVRVGDPLARVKVSKKVREREQVGSLAVAIGLGIED
jgi:type IV pilus assembly protein PilM